MKTLPAEKPKKSISHGQLFQLGDHVLLCGDSTNEANVKMLLEHATIDLILTDPPYGVAYVESKDSFQSDGAQKHKAILNDGYQSDGQYSAFSQAWLTASKPYLNRRNSFYIFNSDRMLFSLQSALKETGYDFKQLLVWLKTGAVIGRLDYLPQHELILYGWSGVHQFMKSKDKSVLIHPKPKKNGLHPTMKPLPLLRRMILNSTKLGEVIYDPFGGSGSTLIACEQTKRRCFMIEYEPKYCQVILDRYKRITGKSPTLLTPEDHEQ
jgi:DNA modification methylase